MKVRMLISIVLGMLTATLAFGQTDLSDKKISLDFQSTPLPSVLNMIAQQNGLNLVVAGEVGGDVSVRLDDVDIATALDAILTANGYTYLVREHVIVVKSIDSTLPADMETRVVTLQYASPQTVAKALNAAKSKNGQVIILDKIAEESSATQNDKYSPNRLMITDYPRSMENLMAVVKAIDVRERSILIEARIIETTLDDNTKLGLNWPSSIEAKASGASDGTATNYYSNTQNTSVGAMNIADGRWTWGKLSIGELRTILDLLDQKGNSKLVSDPRITTVENHQAEFRFETVIPIQTINRFTEGSSTSDIVTFEDEEIGISLQVTPRINGSDTITLDVKPTVEDIIGFSGPSDNQKPIKASRSITTRITVKDGETVALGGLLKEDEIESVKRVPLLGHIPLLGSVLFTNKSKEKRKTDLIIMITPHIID